MKKFLLLLLLCVPTISYADTPMNSVFKIIGYEYDEPLWTYKAAQYGSAVYAGSWIIYTNAHVVLDDDDKPLGNYQVCKTIDFKKAPECFSVGELLYFDTEKDLAALKISDPKTPSVTLETVDPALWDVVKVYGYPANGGTTISYTEGKVSGFENSLYKIDANIDSGNSGGGVFDVKGKLIGLSVSASVGYTTMGYIIPTKTVNDFVSKRLPNQIVTYTGGVNKSFKSFDAKFREVIRTKRINNDFVSLSFGTFGLIPEKYTVSGSWDLFFAHFLNAKKTISTTIVNTQLYWNINYDSYLKNYKRTLNDMYSWARIIEEIKTIWGQSWVVFRLNHQKYGSQFCFLTKINNQIVFLWMGSKYENDPDFIRLVTQISKKIVFKKQKESPKRTSFQFNWLTFNNLSNFGISRNTESTVVNEYSPIQTIDAGIVSSLVLESRFWEGAKYMSLLTDCYYLNEMSLRKTKSLWVYWHAIFDVTKEIGVNSVWKSYKYWVIALFPTKSSHSWKVHFNNIVLLFNDPEDIKKIDDFLGTISVTDPVSFDIKWIEFWKNLVVVPDFELK